MIFDFSTVDVSPPVIDLKFFGPLLADDSDLSRTECSSASCSYLLAEWEDLS